MATPPTTKAISPRAATALYICFIFSGAAGLVYEVIWSNLLGQLAGGTTTTHTVVLAAFMGGLALGNRFGGRWADSGISPLKLYGYLEIVVGILGLLSPQLADLASGIYLALAPAPDAAYVGFDMPLRLLLAVLTILPASFAMGGTLPALVRACTSQLGRLGKSVGWLYFINSAGATAGALIATFLVIPQLGHNMGLILAGATNLFLAVIALSLDRMEQTPVQESPVAPVDAVTQTYSDTQVKAALHAVFLSGMATMTIEIVWTRILALTMGGSVHAFAIMLATFIGGIALGGVIAAWISRTDRNLFQPLLIAEGIAAITLIALMPWYDHLPYLFYTAAATLTRHESAYPLYLATCTSIAVAAMLIPTIAFGATLPLASRVVTSAMSRAGQSVGGVFSINTIGNVLGATLGGLVLVPQIGLEWTLRLGAGLVVLASLRLAVALLKPTRTKTVALVLAAVLIPVLVFMPRWDPFLLHSGLYRTRAPNITLGELEKISKTVSFVFDKDDSEASVAVVDVGEHYRLLKVNGKPDASNRGDIPHQVLVGALPFLFHKQPKRVLVIGLGSGITVGSVLATSVERVDVVEISPAVAEAAKLFNPWSNNALDDPRVHLYVRDARNFIKLLPNDVHYDVIISQPSNPWQPGSAMMFTQDLYELLHSRLVPGGVVSQWIHTYEMSDDVLDVILHTFSRVFPSAHVFNSNGNDVILVSGRDMAAPDLNHMRTLLDKPSVAKELSRITPDKRKVDLPTLLVHEVMGPQTFQLTWGDAKNPKLHTDRQPVLQYQAPKAFFLGEKAKTFRDADARILPKSQSGLLLSQLQLTRDQIKRVQSYLIKRRDPLDAHLSNTLGRYLASLDAEEKAQPQPQDPTACFQHLVSLINDIKARTSVCTAPSMAAFDDARKDCIKRFPTLASGALNPLDKAATPLRVVQ